MFDKIEIERFRGIRYASIEGFKQINLFFGKNNCGKSSLLESLFLVSGLSNPLLSIHVNFMRGYSKVRLNDLKFDFYNLDSTLPIHIRMENEEKRDLKINLFEQNQNNVSLNAEDANILSNVEEGRYGLIQGLKNILQNKDEHFIVEGLKLIEPRVKDFIFTDKEMLVDIGLAKRIPVNMMGDGARKIVSLLTAVYDCKDGALLVDEISNGFHYSVMCNLWKVLINAAIRNNTQLFITTHDTDSIKGLRDAALYKFDNIVAAFKLLKTSDDELKAYHYSLESLDYSINQEIEVR